MLPTRFICFPSFVGLFILAACGNLREKGYDTKAIANEINDRKIKHITPAQFDEMATDLGGQLTQSADRELLATLRAALAKYPLVEAARYCRVDQLVRTDSLVRSYQATWRRASPRDLARTSPLTDKEKALLDAYAYNAANKLPQTPNVQRVAGKYLLYNSPILLSDATCLRCHGTVGKDLSADDWGKLTAQYNLDSLTGRPLNGFVGMWSVNFEKQGMVRRYDAKKLKR